MTRQDSDIRQITNCQWSLWGPHKAMIDAEDAILGDYKNHLSRIDWEPQDEDDEMPRDVESVIQWYPGDTSPLEQAQIFAIAAALGVKARIGVYAQAPAFSVWLDTDGGDHATVWTEVVAAALQERIKRAMRFLSGDER